MVIGSGATAVTLVPAMAEKAAHVTMLQRSPTYVVSRPAEDGFANWLRRKLPAMTAYGITRWRNVLFQMFFYNLARKRPGKDQGAAARDGPDGAWPRLRRRDAFHAALQSLGPAAVPGAGRRPVRLDQEGEASVVTDTIERFTPTGIKLSSGAELPADVIVTATGLELQLLSDVAFSVDGAPVDLSKTFNYKGMMYSDVPNLASSFGYTNASWTLKADLTCAYVCRLLNTMQKRGCARRRRASATRC